MTSFYRDATVFRDKNRNGALDGGEASTVSAADGSFKPPRGNGRLYLIDGFDIQTEAPNRRLLTAPAAARAVGTVTSMWQALLDRGQKTRRVVDLLDLSSGSKVSDFAAVPALQAQGRTLDALKRDAQEDTLVQFIKGLTLGASAPNKTAKIRGDFSSIPMVAVSLMEDVEIGALAQALLDSGQARVDLTDLDSVKRIFQLAFSALGITLTDDQQLALARSASDINKKIAAEPENIAGIKSTTKEAVALIASGDFSTVQRCYSGTALDSPSSCRTVIIDPPPPSPGPVVSSGILSGGKVTLHLADSSAGPADSWDRVDKIEWINSAGNKLSNFVANGGTSCGDKREFFGQSYGNSGVAPLMVFGGLIYTLLEASSTSLTAQTTGQSRCTGQEPAATTTTAYRLYPVNDSGESQIRIQRTFDFSAATPVFQTNGLRAFVPRLPLGSYPIVLFPNANGTQINRVNATACPSGCDKTDWNGKWFADDDGQGNGMVVFRDPTSTAPALLSIDYDSISYSNLSSIVLVQPQGGWKAAVTETEYLCFYDSTTWTPEQQIAGSLPVGCQIKAP